MDIGRSRGLICSCRGIHSSGRGGIHVGYSYAVWNLVEQTPTSFVHGRRQLIVHDRKSEQQACANCRLCQRRGSPQACVPNVCQLRKIRPSSSAFNHCENGGNLLIQRVVDKQKGPQRTSAKKPKTGFVISRSPVRSRRVAPENCLKTQHFEEPHRFENCRSCPRCISL